MRDLVRDADAGGVVRGCVSRGIAAVGGSQWVVLIRPRRELPPRCNRSSVETLFHATEAVARV